MKITHLILTALIVTAALLESSSNNVFAISREDPTHNFDRLLRADVYESIYIGVGGDRSRLVEELFFIVAQPESQAKSSLLDLFTRGTPIAKIYALIGSLMIADAAGTKAYYAGLRELDDTEIRGLDGCDFYAITIAEVIFELRRPSSRLSFKEAYQQWQADQL